MQYLLPMFSGWLNYPTWFTNMAPKMMKCPHLIPVPNSCDPFWMGDLITPPESPILHPKCWNAQPQSMKFEAPVNEILLKTWLYPYTGLKQRNHNKCFSLLWCCPLWQSSHLTLFLQWPARLSANTSNFYMPLSDTKYQGWCYLVHPMVKNLNIYSCRYTLIE